MPTTEFWRLAICSEDGGVANLFGDHDILEVAMDDWKDTRESKQDRLIEIHSVTDSADRAPVHLVIDSETIRSMSLARWWSTAGEE